jgi:hypothetical protein
MQIIVSCSNFSASPILHFHSTILFNFITGAGLFSAYPNMTFHHRGLLNHYHHTIDRLLPPLPPASTQDALAKYARCGFDIRVTPSCWADDEHVCIWDKNCPHTPRNIEDDSCLYMTLRRPEETSRTRMRQGRVTDEVSRNGWYQLGWVLGGESCGGNVATLEGYVSCHPEYCANWRI